MLPHAQHPPTALPERADNESVAGFVPGELRFPERPVAGGMRRVLRAAMPEAAVHEHRKTVLAENKIGIAEQADVTTPAGDTVSAKQRDHGKLSGFVAAPAHTRHNFRPFRFRENVGHQVAVSSSLKALAS